MENGGTVGAEKRITPLSKGDKKRISQEKRDKKKEGIIRSRMAETQFFIRDGKRHVRPYYHDHKLHAKARWYGFTLEHLFLVEFSVSREYFEKALARGDISVNGTIRDPNHQIKHEDVIHHKLHRHEPTVVNVPIKIVADTLDVLAIDKPSSIPIHPSGSYRHNTILDILATEYGYTSKIYPVHRIDRLTSGLLLIARGPDVAKKMGANMMSEKVEKQYIARVCGEFPSDIIVSEEPIGPWPGRRGLQRISADGKSAHTTFKRIKFFPDDTSLVLCTLKTGRTHQIRVHLKGLGYPIANDPAYGPTSPSFDYIPPNGQATQSDELDDEEIYATSSPPLSPSFPLPSPTSSLLSTPFPTPSSPSTVPSSSIPSLSSTQTYYNEEIPKNTPYSTISIPFSSQTPSPPTPSPPTAPSPSTVPSPSVLSPSLQSGGDHAYDEICDFCTGKRKLVGDNASLIWLHAVRYESAEWKFEAPLPEWANIGNSLSAHNI